MSTVTVHNFRTMLPEFADSSAFLDEQVQTWLDAVSSQLDACRWGAWYTMGVCMFVAHQMALSRPDQLTAARGGTPGRNVGAVSGKSVNGVSISYDTSAARLTDGADFNLTTYGIRFLFFARMVGAGGVQLVGADASNVSEADLLNGTVPNSPLGIL